MTAGKRYNQAKILVPWTAQDKATALRMNKDGHTAREIAAVLKRTRNSVFGWFNRQGLHTGVMKARAKPREPKPEKPKKQKPPRPLQSVRVTSFHHFTKDDPQRYEPYQPLVFEDLEPTMRLIDSGQSHCRWIAGEPIRDQTLICGRETDGNSSYCALHYGIVYPRKIARAVRIENNAP